jgi:hypothetical protein
MLAADVPFYRLTLPAYASLLHPGGAPPWATEAWLKAVTHKSSASEKPFILDSAVVAMLETDVRHLDSENATRAELIAALFGRHYKEKLRQLAESEETDFSPMSP